MFRRGESEVSIRKDPAPAVAGGPLRIESGSKVNEQAHLCFSRWPPRAPPFRWRHRPRRRPTGCSSDSIRPHSGINPDEFLLTPGNVHLLALKYYVKFNAPAQGTPVFLSNVATSQGTIDMLFVQLNEGSLFALNAANGAHGVVARYRPARRRAVRPASSPQCLITSSPAIDPNRNFVYIFSRNDGKIHKYAVATGVETHRQRLAGTFLAKPDVEKGSSAIAFATSSTDHDTYLYMTHSSFLANDGGDYQGHITAINLRTGTQIVFNAVCSDQGNVHFIEGGNTAPNDGLLPACRRRTSKADPIPAGNAGIWGRAAATYDPSNDSIYISTANGVYDPTNQFNYGGSFWGDSVLRLPAALSTPNDRAGGQLYAAELRRADA